MKRFLFHPYISIWRFMTVQVGISLLWVTESAWWGITLWLLIIIVCASIECVFGDEVANG